MAKNKLLCAAEGLRDALLVTMAECGAKPCRISLSPTSATPIDVCCDCGDGDGQAWVSLISAKPLYDEAAGNAPCAFEREAMFVLGIARCAAKIDDHGNTPSADELNADFEKLMRDQNLMAKAITLYVTEADVDKQMYRFGDYDVHPVRDCMVATQEVFLVIDCGCGGC